MQKKNVMKTKMGTNNNNNFHIERYLTYAPIPGQLNGQKIAIHVFLKYYKKKSETNSNLSSTLIHNITTSHSVIKIYSFLQSRFGKKEKKKCKCTGK